MSRILWKHCRTSEHEMVNILIQGQKIISVGSDEPRADEIFDLSGKIVLPGMIDPHVHMRDLGQKDKEDWTSGSRAALAGGVTTVFDMPNTVPATLDPETLELKRKFAEKSDINYKFYLGATEGNLDSLQAILRKNPDDVAGIKVFLAASSSREVITNRETLVAVCRLAREYDRIVCVHTELQECIDIWQASTLEPLAVNHHLLRNRVCAIEGTKICLDIANEIKCKLYIAHVTTEEEIELIRVFKNDNRIYCEVTPHHLLLEHTILEKIGNIGKVNPPLRTERDLAALWQGIEDGTVDTVGSDHAPHLLSEKGKPYQQAPAGFPGLETTLPLLINEFNQNRLDLQQIARLTSGNAARIFDLKEKGRIEPGCSADLSVIDPAAIYRVDPEKFASRARFSPFAGRELYGKVEMTMVNGSIKFRGDGK
ncbi:MAG: dihydroorotase family protein [Candidatus Cloacimonetes bacterium]|nr:dihydroorotase family protein [Candidatus Cloacimonadota bacterium]